MSSTTVDGSDSMQKCHANIFVTGMNSPLLQKTVCEILETDVRLDELKHKFVRNHTLKNKYFVIDATTTICPLRDFAHLDSEILVDLDAIKQQSIFFYVRDLSDNTAPDDLEKLRGITELLQDVPGFLVTSDMNSEKVPVYEELGFEVIEVSEIKNEIACAIGNLSDNEEDGEQNPQQQRSLQEIYDQIMKARNSTTMTPEEKKALADSIAGELVP